MIKTKLTNTNSLISLDHLEFFLEGSRLRGHLETQKLKYLLSMVIQDVLLPPLK
jgi:hypothetical protein